MTEKQLDFFRFGYSECRRVNVFQLKKILGAKSGHKALLAAFLEALDNEEAVENSKLTQKEFPGVTADDIAKTSEQSKKEILKKFYNPSGHLKFRIVRD